MRLFDSHTHIQFPEFEGDRTAMLERSREAGLVGLLVLGTDVASSETAISLAEREPDVIAAAGCHPHEAEATDEASLLRLAELASDPHVAVIGEIGLDFFRNLSPQERQIEVLRRQLATAANLGKPVAVHCRDAQETLLPIMETWSRDLGGRLPDGRPLGVMHYFSGDVDLAAHYVELGFLISIHCSVTYPKNTYLQNVARRVALDALVVETDSPYGPPQSRRGQRNEPACVAEVVSEIAELRSESGERIAEATTENALRLFGAAASGPVATSQARGNA